MASQECLPCHTGYCLGNTGGRSEKTEKRGRRDFQAAGEMSGPGELTRDMKPAKSFQTLANSPIPAPWITHFKYPSSNSWGVPDGWPWTDCPPLWASQGSLWLLEEAYEPVYAVTQMIISNLPLSVVLPNIACIPLIDNYTFTDLLAL